MNSAIFVAAVIWSFLCHFVEARPDSQGPSSSSSDLDTSFFDTDSDYDYEPYFVPTSNFKSEVKDPWTYDFRNKLAENKDIGKHFYSIWRLWSLSFRKSVICQLTSSAEKFTSY